MSDPRLVVVQVMEGDEEPVLPTPIASFEIPGEDHLAAADDGWEPIPKLPMDPLPGAEDLLEEPVPEELPVEESKQRYLVHPPMHHVGVVQPEDVMTPETEMLDGEETLPGTPRSKEKAKKKFKGKR